MTELSERALEERARRAAKSVGLRAVKSRRHVNSADNLGGFQLIHARENFVFDGARFDMSAQDVIEVCKTAKALCEPE